jgi:CelD/BcsL family acetyltransferase involved in cellulose biosynthesis
LRKHLPPLLTVEVVDGFGPLADEWQELAERADAAPFLYPGWVRAWRAAFGAGDLRLFAARRAGQLVGLVPMQLRRGVLRSTTNAHTPRFDLLALDEETARALAAAVFAQSAREVAVAPLDVDGRGLGAFLAAAHAGGYSTMLQPAARAPFLRLASGVAAHEQSLSRNLRHDVERRLRRLCEVGVVSVQVADGSEQLEDLLEQGFRVEQLSWKGRQRTAIASRERTLRFYGELARWAPSTGSLRLAFLRLDGRPIAFQFDLETEPTYYSLKIGYDPEYERFSPGKLLAYTMVSRAVARGIAVYELLGTDESWKYRWTDDVHERVAFRAFSHSAAGRIASSTFLYARPLVRRMPFAGRVAAALRR